jgi:glucokinase
MANNHAGKHDSEATPTMVQQSVPNAIERNHSPGPEDHCAIGVDIGGTNLRLALADAAGTILGRWHASTVGVRSAELVLDLISSGVDHLLAQASIPRAALRAIAAGVPGVVDVDAGVVLATSYLMGWRDVPFRSMLEAALCLPAFIDNDVNMAAYGEISAGAAKGVRDFVFLAIGTGVGSGIVLNGEIFHGMAWSAGEIGYMLVPGTSEEPAKSNDPGALEELIGGEGIKTQWQNLWSADITQLPKDLTATQIFDHAQQGDPLAQSVLDRSARLLSHAIYNIALMLNCPLFVLGGTVGMHPALCAATQAMLEQRSAQVCLRIEPSQLGADASLLGAIRMALHTAALRATAS